MPPLTRKKKTNNKNNKSPNKLPVKSSKPPKTIVMNNKRTAHASDDDSLDSDGQQTGGQREFSSQRNNYHSPSTSRSARNSGGKSTRVTNSKDKTNSRSHPRNQHGQKPNPRLLELNNLDDNSESVRAMEDENDKLRQELADMKKNQSSKMPAKNDAMKKLIRSAVMNSLWRTTKFVTSPEQSHAFALKIFDALEISDEDRDKINKGLWMRTYESWCITALNQQRTYTVGRIKDVVTEYLGQGRDCPTLNQIRACSLRKCVSGELKDMFLWYVNVLLPRAVGNCHDFNANKRCFETPSLCHYAGFPNKLCVTNSTEGFLVVAFDGYRQVWLNQFALKEEKGSKTKVPRPRHKDGKLVDEADKKWLAKYTNSDTGSKCFSGWTTQGIKAFQKYTVEIKKARATPESAALEALTVPKIRMIHEIEAVTLAEHEANKRKRPAQDSARPVVEIEFEDEE